MISLLQVSEVRQIKGRKMYHFKNKKKVIDGKENSKIIQSKSSVTMNDASTILQVSTFVFLDDHVLFVNIVLLQILELQFFHMLF